MTKVEHSVLIVDDDANHRQLLLRRLQKDGYIITAVENGKEAIEHLAVESFDIVILDLHMPGVNGYQVLEWLKQKEIDELNNVIVFSSDQERESVVSCLTLGAKDYLVKPASTVEILSRVRRLCRTKELEEIEHKKVSDEQLTESTLLIVDDDELNRSVLRRRMENAKFKTIEAENGKQALELINDNEIDLIFLDLNMPEMDGFEVLSKIRSEKSPAEIAVIMVTGVNDNEDIKKCYELGADDFVNKPFNGVELLARTRAALRLKILQATELMKSKRIEELVEHGESIRS